MSRIECKPTQLDEALDAAADWLEAHRLLKGSPVDGWDKPTGACLTGAIWIVAPEFFHEAHALLDVYLGEHPEGWNDKWYRAKRGVVKALRGCAAWERRHQR